MIKSQWRYQIFKHQKAPGEGGHHLGLFDPLTHLLRQPGQTRSVTHLTHGVRRLKGLLALERTLSGGNTFHFKRYRYLKAEYFLKHATLARIKLAMSMGYLGAAF